jgi:hypothetical protein
MIRMNAKRRRLVREVYLVRRVSAPDVAADAWLMSTNGASVADIAKHIQRCRATVHAQIARMERRIARATGQHVDAAWWYRLEAVCAVYPRWQSYWALPPPSAAQIELRRADAQRRADASAFRGYCPKCKSDRHWRKECLE